MPNSARPINELTGIKKPSSVLIRGASHMEIAKQIGAIPWSWTEVEYVEWAKGPRGYSTYELWQQIPGNENGTIEDFFDYLGFVQAAQEAAIIAQIAADAATASAAAAAALVSENNAETAETNAETAQAAAVVAKVAAEAAQAAAEAAAASFNAATEADIRTQTNNTKFATALGLSSALAWVDASGGLAGEYAAGTWTPNMKAGFNRSLTMTANTTIAAPTNLVDGQTYQWLLRQDATGGRSVTVNAKFVPGSNAFSFIGTANAYTVLTGTYHAGLDKIINCTTWKSA